MAARPGGVRGDDMESGVVDPLRDPTRGPVVGRRPKVAAGDGDGDGRGRERAEQVPAQPIGDGVGGGEAGCGTVGVGQERVAARGRREGSLRAAEHDHHIDVEPDGAREGADRDAVADAALAAGRVVELGLERRPELAPGDRLGRPGRGGGGGRVRGSVPPTRGTRVRRVVRGSGARSIGRAGRRTRPPSPTSAPWPPGARDRSATRR